MDIEKITTEITYWIELQRERHIHKSTCATHRSFGLITMYDGRKAQVQVTLELDEDNWV